MTIQLPPSGDTSALTNAIETASATNQPLVLLPGVHFTKPGYNLRIPIGPHGLHLSGTAAARIQRPDCSVGDNPLHRTDSNFGLFLVPARPLIPEPADMPWQVHQPAGGPPIEFIIVAGGTVTISGVTLDCNMGNQALEGLPKKLVEHSAMLAISGARYDFSSPSGLQRAVFVTFEDVRLENLTLVRGGFADDIMFPPSYFRPNISSVTVTHLTSEQRINPFRASVSFTGLSQRIVIRDCILDSLACEEDAVWSEYPGPAGPFERSLWSVDEVRARAMGYAAKGDVLTLTASQLNVTESFSINEASGAISDSRLAVATENRRLIRLRDFHFGNCTWILKPDSTNRVNGIIPTAAHDIPCSATFDNNSFVVDGSFGSGQIITTGQHSPPGLPNNAITVRFTDCQYPPGFGTTANPNTHVAVLAEHGDYMFKRADLQNLDLNQAIIASNATVSEPGDHIKYHIP
jgi:hypothetical protein